MMFEIRSRYWLIIPTVIAITGIAFLALANPSVRDIVVSLEEAKFTEVVDRGSSDSSIFYPGGAKIAFAPLFNDPATGRSSYLLKWSKGAIKRHYHTSDYQLVVLKGVMTHWTEKMPQAGEKQLGTGGYYFQPGGGVHAETCLTDECITLSTFFAKADTKVAED